MFMELAFTKYQTIIAKQLDELEKENRLGQNSQTTVELDQQAIGRLSRMDALQSQAMAQAQQRRRDALKKSLKAALQRLNDDEFGYCLECGDALEEARLLANPTVLLCMPCLKS